MRYENLPKTTQYGMEIEYEPKWGVTGLDWFQIAQCARARMTDRANNIEQWRGERRSFYTALRFMKVEEVVFMDE